MAVEFESGSLFLDLREWVVNRLNGVVFVTTVRKRVLCLNLTDGYITYCAGAGQHGLDAVEALKGANIANYSFNPEGNYPFRMRDEVVHEAVLASLEDKFRQAGLAATHLRSGPGSNESGPEAGEPGAENGNRVYVSARMRVPAKQAQAMADTGPTLPNMGEPAPEADDDRVYVSARMRRPAKQALFGTPSAPTPPIASEPASEANSDRLYVSARMRTPAKKTSGAGGGLFGFGKELKD